MALLLVASAASAQVCEQNCTADVGEPVTVFTESDWRASGYLLRRNGVVEVNPYVLTSGMIEFRLLSGLTAGTHVFTIELIGVEETYPGSVTVVAPTTPSSLECRTSGMTYLSGATIIQTMQQRYVSGYLDARKAEGWALTSTSKVKNNTTVTMTCAGR